MYIVHTILKLNKTTFAGHNRFDLPYVFHTYSINKLNLFFHLFKINVFISTSFNFQNYFDKHVFKIPFNSLNEVISVHMQAKCRHQK